jgi:hypothetical protein
MAFQDGDDVILRFCGTLRRDQKRLDSAAGPARNHCLHEVGCFRVKRFHDPCMPPAPLICARGDPTSQRETQTKLALDTSAA